MPWSACICHFALFYNLQYESWHLRELEVPASTLQEVSGFHSVTRVLTGTVHSLAIFYCETFSLSFYRTWVWKSRKTRHACRPSELWGHRSPPVAQIARHGHWRRVFPSSQTPGEPASQHTGHWLVTYEYEHTFCLLLNWHFYFERIYIHVQLWIQGNCVSFTWCVVSVGGRRWEEVQSVRCHQDPTPLCFVATPHPPWPPQPLLCSLFLWFSHLRNPWKLTLELRRVGCLPELPSKTHVMGCRPSVSLSLASASLGVCSGQCAFSERNLCLSDPFSSSLACPRLPVCK